MSGNRLINLFLHLRELRPTDEARLTIRNSDGEHVHYLEIFVWGSDVPDERHFTKTTLIDSDIELSSVAETLKLASVSCVVVSLIGPSYDVDSPQPLSRLLSGYAEGTIHELWTQRLCWKYLQTISLQESQSWATLKTITLDLIIDTMEDEACCVNVMAKGHLKRFLAGLKMIEHLGLFFSNLAGYDSQLSHGPLEHILDTQVTWSYLKSIRLNGFNSTAQELIHFLINQSTTLRALKLHNYLLLTRSWLDVLPELRDSLDLCSAEVAGVIEGSNELWLIKIPGQQEKCFLAEDLTYWLTHRKVNLLCPLSKENMARDSNLHEDEWE